jgi:(p)ppGpp synthase/HD superfamily hydrolase
MKLVRRAKAFAATAHAEQKRKYTGEPYTVHLEEVAALVAAVGAPEAVVAAAWLHDTVEDTEVTLDQVRAAFGDDVARMVEALTDEPWVEGKNNRATRKALDRTRLAKADPWTQTIKLADLISNSATILERDPKFAKVYLAEKRALLEVMTRGNDWLAYRAHAILPTERKRA